MSSMSLLHNGQISVLVFGNFGAEIDCDSILLFFLPLKVSTVGDTKGLIQRSLIKVAHIIHFPRKTTLLSSFESIICLFTVTKPIYGLCREL